MFIVLSFWVCYVAVDTVDEGSRYWRQRTVWGSPVRSWDSQSSVTLNLQESGITGTLTTVPVFQSCWSSIFARPRDKAGGRPPGCAHYDLTKKGWRDKWIWKICSPCREMSLFVLTMQPEKPLYFLLSLRDHCCKYNWNPLYLPWVHSYPFTQK